MAYIRGNISNMFSIFIRLGKFLIGSDFSQGLIFQIDKICSILGVDEESDLKNCNSFRLYFRLLLKKYHIQKQDYYIQK